MKKYLSLIGLIVLSSNSIFIAYIINNFITTNGYNKIKADVWSNQSANFIKAIITSKEKNIDILETIQNIPKNLYNNKKININSWQDIQKHWGYNQVIKTEGFNPEKFFIKNSLSTEANFYKKIYDIFNELETNNTIKSSLEVFLNNLKETNTDELSFVLKKAIILIKNSILGVNWNETLTENNKEKKDYFKINFIEPLISFLNFFINNQWSDTQTKPPSSFQELKDFIYSWKDEDKAFYSQWIAKIQELKLTEDDVKDWTIRDYNFYRSGVLINYLFYKIGKDYQIKRNTSWMFSAYRDRYLGDIIADNSMLFSNSSKDFMTDLNQYLPHLLENPQYIFLLAQVLVPILKDQVIPLSSRNDPNHYLFLEAQDIIKIINKTEDILENPEKINEIIDNLLDSSLGYAIKIAIFSFKDEEIQNKIDRKTWKKELQNWVSENKEEINNYLFLIKREFNAIKKEWPNFNLIKNILSILLKEFNKEVIPVVLQIIKNNNVSDSISNSNLEQKALDSNEKEVDLLIKSLINFYNNIKSYYKETFNNYIKKFYETNESSKIYNIKMIKNNLSYILEYKINGKTYILNVKCYIDRAKKRFYFTEIKLITIKR